MAKFPPGMNSIGDLQSFLESWTEKDHPANCAPVAFSRTAAGNINSTGIPGNYSGPVISKWHPAFFSAIEPGVRELVTLFLQDFGWLTYTSCEGHPYIGSEIPPAERMVGLIPADSRERRMIAGVSTEIGGSLNQGRGACCLVLHEHEVTSEQGNVSTQPALDVIITRKSRSTMWDEYFRHLEQFYRNVIGAFSRSVGRD